MISFYLILSLSVNTYQAGGIATIGHNVLTVKYSNEGYFASITGVMECDENQMVIPKILTINQRKFILRSISNRAFALINTRYISLPEGVRSIHKEAFAASDIVSIHIPSTLRRIHHSAFENCSELTEIDLSKCRVIILGSNSFYKCKKLTIVQLPFCLTEIGANAFAFSNVTQIQFPSSIKTIQSSAFENCLNLTEVNFGNTALKRIHSSCFNKCKRLTSVVFSRNLTHIYKYAFNGTAIKIFSLPQSVVKIGYQSLSSYRLKSVHIPNTNTIYKTDQGILYNAKRDSLILYPSSIHSKKGRFTLLGSVTSIDPHSCMYMNITHIEIPKSVQEIGDYAFYGGKFENITLPNSITEIGDCAFEKCTELKFISLQSTQITDISHKCFASCSKLSKISIPSGIRSIGFKAFFNTSISTLEIPQTCTKIGYGFASLCKHLKTLTVNKENKKFVMKDGALYSSDFTSIILLPLSSAGSGFRVMKETNFIAPLSFAYLKIETIKLGKHVECIGSYAFYSTVISNIEFPASLQTISSRAFMKCSNLTTVNTQSTGLEVIGSFAFMGCKNLLEVTLPSSLKSVGERAFKSCSSLKLVKYFGVKDLTGKAVFEGSTPIVYVTRRFPQVTLAGLRVRSSNN